MERNDFDFRFFFYAIIKIGEAYEKKRNYFIDDMFMSNRMSNKGKIKYHSLSFKQILTTGF